MGNITGMVVFFSMLSMLMLVTSYSLTEVDPCNALSVSMQVFNSQNILRDNIDGVAYSCAGTVMYGSYSFSNDLSSQVGSNVTRGTTGSLSGSSPTPATIFPDWLFTSFNWLLGAGFFVVNIIGLPFTLFSWMLPDSSLASIIGASFSVILLFLFVNYIRGSDT